MAGENKDKGIFGFRPSRRDRMFLDALKDIARALREKSSEEITPKMIATIEKIAAEVKAQKETLAAGTEAPVTVSKD